MSAIPERKKQAQAHACPALNCGKWGNWRSAETGRYYCSAHAPDEAVPRPSHRCERILPGGKQCTKLVSEKASPLGRLCGLHSAGVYAFLEHVVLWAMELGQARGSISGLGKVVRQAHLQGARQWRLDAVMADATLGASLHLEVDEDCHRVKAKLDVVRQVAIAGDRPQALPAFAGTLRLWATALLELVRIRAAFDAAVVSGGGVVDTVQVYTRERSAASVVAATAGSDFAPC